MTVDENIKQLQANHDKLQEGLPSNKMKLREGIVLNIGDGDYTSYPRFSFQFFCFRNPDCVKELDLFIKYSAGKKCLLDVGAYAGLFSLAFTEINKEGIAYAFEPYREPFSMLSKMCEGNSRIGINQAALSDNTGHLPFFEFGGHLTSKRGSEAQQPVYAHAVTGDSFCFGIVPNIEPDIIKIDTEGNELQVLRGLSNILAKHHPIVFLELHCSQLSQQEVISIMNIIGYFQYNVIDVDTDKEMPLSNLLTFKEGEKRIILK